jgi:hypothetical protein
VINPIELISRSRSRLARLAAGRVAITGLPLVAVALGLGASVNPIAARAWQHWGYRLAPADATILRTAALSAAGLAALATAVQAWRAWRRANDFAQAAQQVDALIDAHQEILTLATLADPARPAAHDRRSPLFALLWRRAVAYLERFEPNRAFPLAPGEPLKRAALCAAAAAVVLGLAMLALMRIPSAVEAAAERLRNFAGSAATTNTPGAEQLAAAARDVANDLDNPRLPPRQKLAELEAIKREIEKIPQPPPNAQTGAGKSQGEGKSNGNGAGQGSGGSGEGAGGANNKGAGAGTGGGGKSNKSEQHRMALKNDLAKAQAKLEAEANSGKSESAQNQDRKGSGFAPQAGANPHQGGAQTRPNGTDNIQLPEPGKLGLSMTTPSSNTTTAHKNDTGAQGDTHLGDFPKAAAYERFYKLGDKGPPLDLKNARYVTFRIPPAVAAGGGGGRTVHDSGASAATTPYTNAPLKAQPLVAAPDEEQLLPPRYRDLIR